MRSQQMTGGHGGETILVNPTVTGEAHANSAHRAVMGHGPASGRIPFVLRIGVTGHRRLADPEAVTTAVRKALSLIIKAISLPPPTHLVLVAVSALAEGSDRLVAREILSHPGARLEVALPLPRAEYAADFETDQSKREFHALLERATKVWQAPGLPTREERYEWAGRHVADSCDVLIAIWDGQPSRGRGGTAEVVAYARANDVPMVWIRTSGEPVLNPELGTGQIQVLREAARNLNEYNTRRIKHTSFESQMTRQLGYLGISGGAADPAADALSQACSEVAECLMPFFVRADLLALRLQSRFRVISIAMFAMAAMAVAIVAVQATFWPAANWVAGFEVLLLLLLLGIPMLRGRLRLHERWTSHRFLAERLRSAYFLALAGTGDRAQLHGKHASFADPSVAWIERALIEVLGLRPRPAISAEDVVPLRGYLSTYWIEDQRMWHARASVRHAKRDMALRRATAALFGITLVSAVLHLLGTGDGGSRPTLTAATIIVLSISIPAVGAAIHGIQTQSMDRHHSERFKRMSTLLANLVKEMTQADDLRQIQDVAVSVERVMREENNDWFGVMRFHDVELIT
jgi:hypothetical protein